MGGSRERGRGGHSASVVESRLRPRAQARLPELGSFWAARHSRPNAAAEHCLLRVGPATLLPWAFAQTTQMTVFETVRQFFPARPRAPAGQVAESLPSVPEASTVEAAVKAIVKHGGPEVENLQFGGDLEAGVRGGWWDGRVGESATTQSPHEARRQQQETRAVGLCVPKPDEQVSSGALEQNR